MIKLLLVVYTLYVFLIGFLIFAGHYVVASLLTLFQGEKKIQRFYDLAIPFIKLGFFLLGMRVKVEGEEHIPDSNAIIVCNHQSVLDIVMMMIATPKRITFFAKKELSKIPFVNGDIKNMGHVFVDRENARRSAKQLDLMQAQLDAGRTIILFPEGTRSTTQELLPFKRGVFVLAARSKKPLLPVYIDGANKLINKKSFLCRPGTVTVRFGKPTTEFESLDEKELSKQLKEKLFKDISALKK